MSYLCTAQTSLHKLELEVGVHKLMHLVVSNNYLVLYKEGEEHQQEAEEVAPKATAVEVEVLKALIEVGVLDTKTIIAIISIKEALNYNNNQTYLGNW